MGLRWDLDILIPTYILKVINLEWFRKIVEQHAELLFTQASRSVIDDH